MRDLATPEMVGYFSEELSANASRGVENKVEQVKLEQGDLSETWSEAGLDYATVAMRFSMIDVTRRIADGKVVEGDDQSGPRRRKSGLSCAAAAASGSCRRSSRPNREVNFRPVVVLAPAPNVSEGVAGDAARDHATPIQ